MQHRRRRIPRSTSRSFNPHPPREADATLAGSSTVSGQSIVFQSSPAPRGGCNFGRLRSCTALDHVVSILTRPERRMQHGTQAATRAIGTNPVSILTRPERRMQRSWRNAPSVIAMSLTALFQSSPAPRGGCNLDCDAACLHPCRVMFQSSPAPRGGCN